MLRIECERNAMYVGRLERHFIMEQMQVGAENWLSAATAASDQRTGGIGADTHLTSIMDFDG